MAGGDDGIRTHDLCSAIAALSQLSYIPETVQKVTLRRENEHSEVLKTSARAPAFSG
jgi:hypothetical protein